MRHLDLFSGIGGFAYAIDQVWDDVEHTFCDNDKFCQQVLRKHWPNAKIYGDIREIITDTEHDGVTRTEKAGKDSGTQSETPSGSELSEHEHTGVGGVWGEEARWDIVTGGFPCQPFSQAGKRRGTDDNRYLWPEMFRVIQLTKPTWVIAENVYGILNIEGGMVFEQVCTDLEGEGFEVQPFIIPAVSVNAPHRRDRVWFVAHRNDARSGTPEHDDNRNRQEGDSGRQKQSLDRASRQGNEPSADTRQQYGEQGNDERMGTDTTKGSGRFGQPCGTWEGETQNNPDVRGWDENWVEIATELCRMDDGLPAELDGFELSKAGHRKERLKSLGNAIVPQVAMEILKAIKYTEGKFAP